jgi:hypothetical protein
VKKYSDRKKKVERQVKFCEIANFWLKSVTHKPEPADHEYTRRSQKNKLSLIALHLLTRDMAEKAILFLEGTVSDICKLAGVNRTQVYEKKAQLTKAFEKVELPEPGRSPVKADPVPDNAGWALQVTVLQYRLSSPGAVVRHPGGRTGYSTGFRRIILDLFDDWTGSQERFCELVEVPYPTLETWKARDANQSYAPVPPRPVPEFGIEASDVARMIIEDYAVWQGSVRDFLQYEPGRVDLPPNQIVRVLKISKMISSKKRKSPRYRGSTQNVQPGTILVTDGKGVSVHLTASKETRNYNWQGMVDQATACHTAVVVTETENAQGVVQAYEQSVEFLGRKPEALVHDNKPIHEDRLLRETIERETTMIPATPRRPENKAVIEGEFGKFEQAVGRIKLDDTSPECVTKSAVEEVLRAYTAGINHAGRYEFEGLSRLQVLRRACPDPEKDRAFLENLKGRRDLYKKPDQLPTMGVARQLLDKGFTDFGLDVFDPKGALRTWLSSRYTPESIRQGLAIFATQRAKGRLHSDTAHRYLIKVIQNCQDEIDLRQQEDYLLEYAEVEKRGMLRELEREYELLKAECERRSGPANDLAFQLSEKVVFGGIILQRSFWEAKLKKLLIESKGRIASVIRHIRRLFEAHWNDCFQLINRLVSWSIGLTV